MERTHQDSEGGHLSTHHRPWEHPASGIHSVCPPHLQATTSATEKCHMGPRQQGRQALFPNALSPGLSRAWLGKGQSASSTPANTTTHDSLAPRAMG